MQTNKLPQARRSYYFSLCVTFARATPKAWMAVNGYWKSRV